MTEQNYASHVKWVPTFHFFVIPVMLLNFGWSIGHLVRGGFTWGGLVGVLTSLALVLLTFHARLFALRVQDRVIRLEERQRMNQLLPDDLKPRIAEFTPAQLVALRFAGDAELPDLARKVLADKNTNIRAIKQMVKNWRADYLRA
jgi:2-phospho-L-lactate transferase/gluconeogenesis factor (CofD/UPF0052 family)